MIKYRHIFLVILAILLLFAACSTVPENPTSPTGKEPTNNTEKEETIPPSATRPEPTFPDPSTVEMKINCQYLPQNIENPDNLPVLKWVCLTEYSAGGKYGSVWNEAAAIELNQMLADRNMPFRVQFALYTTDYPYFNMDWFSRPEVQAAIAEADLLHGTVAAEKASDYFMPLTEYVKGNATPSLKNAVPHKINWLQSSANGEVYGISQKLRNPTSGGWVVDADVLEEYDLTEQDLQKDFWEIGNLLDQMQKKSGKQELMYISSSIKTTSTSLVTDIERRYPGLVAAMLKAYFEGIGSVFAINGGGSNPTVVNMLDTELTRTIREAAIRYKDKYKAPDLVAAKVYFSETIGHDTYTTSNDTYGMLYHIPVTESTYYSTESMTLMRCSGVAVGTNYKNEALSLLNLIAEDEEFRMQLMFGKEGRDYTVDAEGNYSNIKQEDGSNYCMSFLSPWSNLTGMKGGSGQFPGTEGVIPQYEGMTVLESYLEMWKNVGDPYYTIRFDYSGLEDELEAVKNVCDLYFYRFATMSDEKYAEMIEKINEAGGTKIMAELQKQLDEWVKANPDKVAANRS